MTPLEVKEKYEFELLKIPGVVGVRATKCDLVVYIESEDVQVPDEIEGVPVRKVVIGKVRVL